MLPVKRCQSCESVYRSAPGHARGSIRNAKIHFLTSFNFCVKFLDRVAFASHFASHRTASHHIIFFIALCKLST